MNPDANRGLYQLFAFGLAVALALIVFFIAASQGIAIALATAIFGALVIFSLGSSRVAMYSLIVAMSFDGVYKAMAPGMISLLVKDFFLLLLLFRLFLVSQRERDYSWMDQPVTIPSVLFVLYCAAMMLAPSMASPLLALAGLRVWTLWMPIYFPAYHLFNTRRAINQALVVLLVVQLPICVYGIIQGNIGYEHTRAIPAFYALTRFYGVSRTVSVTGDPLGDAGSATWGDGASEGSGEGFERGFRPIMSVRACSVCVSPGAFGAAAGAMVLFALGAFAYFRHPTLRLLAIITALAALGGLLASGSRAAMVGVLVGGVAAALISRRRAALVVGIGVTVLAGLYILRDVTGAGARRIGSGLTLAGAIQRSMQPLMYGWEDALEQPLGNGIATGIGAGRMVYSGEIEVKRAQGARFIENEFGRALSEMGFPGTALWVYMVVQYLIVAARNVRRLGATPEAALGAGLFGAMIGTFVQLGVGSALYGMPGMVFYLAAALVARLTQTLQRGAGASDQTPDAISAPRQAPRSPSRISPRG